MQPLIAVSFSFSSLGTDSPVSAEVSTAALPSITVPSNGIFFSCFYNDYIPDRDF